MCRQLRIILHNLVFFSVAVAANPVFAQPDLSRILQGVENRYNRPKTMHFSFDQTLSGGGRLTRSEHGELYLQKPGKMRWDYADPPGKFFLADGKYAYYYSPAARRVEKSPLKETDDLRAPLAFLMGRLDFRRDFKEFRLTPEGANTYIVATPKSDKAPYTQVAFLVTPQFRIDLLRVNGQDGSIMVYRLSDEKINPALKAEIFEFKLPAGAQVEEEAGQP